MSEMIRYWAEEALGEPYAPQDYSWMKSTRRLGVVLGGVTCVVTTSALLGAAAYRLVDRSPRVMISGYEIEVATQIPGAALAAPVATASNQSIEVARQALVRQPAPAGPSNALSAKGAATASLPASVAPPTPPTLRLADMPRRAPAAPAGTPLGLPERLGPARAADAATTPKLEPDTRIGLSKAAESKPTDIASGEKLGIREILPDGIVMQNGRRVKNGAALPNGEILMGTDTAKGMVETDRRLLVLTP